MKQFFCGLTLIALTLTNVFAEPVNRRAQLDAQVKNTAGKTNPLPSSTAVQTNLIGEVTAIDQSAGKIVVQTEAKTSVTVTVNDKTVFRRVAPGQTSLAGAEQITVADVKIGDRVLIPGGVAAEQAAVRQFIVMAREAINAQRDKERETRRARTINGQITAVNAEKREIIIQARGRGNAEALTVAASPNAKLTRYAPDSLKPADAKPGAFADLRVGDQIRVVGDKNADGTRVAAEEILSGSVTRSVGTISEINQTRGEVVVKNAETGQLTTVAVGKNTTLRRISPEVADALKQRFDRRRERRAERASGNAEQPPQQTQENRRRNRGERRNRAGGDANQNNNPAGNQAGNRNPQQMFENLPAIKIADLKKGDAVLITATSGGNSQMTAVSIVTGAAEMRGILQQTQGGRRGQGNMSPGLPGNVGGGNAGSDDDPRE
ncbi:MAG TPA: hypothetical protein VNI84_01585 [Pyrinomonadaceae bacterium]|nr:hypothetical protein [Pyrinomonadaceae bacterium]